VANKGLTDAEAVKQAQVLLDIRAQEKQRLDDVRHYLKPDRNRRINFLVTGTPREVVALARISKVNLMPFVLRSAYQSMYVEGFRIPPGDENHPAWAAAWQANKMDARQIGIHKAALAYGKSYATVLPGERGPMVRGHSPRILTTAWRDDEDWPEYAIEWRARSARWRLYDSTHIYEFVPQGDPGTIPQKLDVVDRRAHNMGVTPVVCYHETVDLDDPPAGIIEPLYDLQDQTDLTTFGLMVAQHYGAFRQRYILGWLGDDEAARLKMSASRLMTFEDSGGPDGITVGEFGQTDLSGYIASREATVRHMAITSQTSVAEMLGTLANLSADALAAADESRNRASTEYRTVMGEDHEQMLGLAGRLIGNIPDQAAETRWRDTRVTTLAQLVDALGKAATMLEIPSRALWDPFADAIGASQTEVARWDTLRQEAQKGDALSRLVDSIDRQGRGPGANNS
jgi:hypothetical protein